MSRQPMLALRFPLLLLGLLAVALATIGVLYAGSLPATARAASDTPSTGEPDPGGPRIVQPAAGDSVGQVIEVVAQYDGPLPEGRFLTVAVRPIPDDPNQSFWVQSSPSLVASGADSTSTWSSQPVFVGQERDRGRQLTFRVCASLTSREYTRGQQLATLPDGPHHCIDVTRQ